jgi:hypothetical protein
MLHNTISTNDGSPLYSETAVDAAVDRLLQWLVQLK